MSRSETEAIFSEVVTGFGKPEGEEIRSSLVSAPLLAALRQAGTSHIYADTADTHELAELLSAGKDKLFAEVDGNTANQPLVQKVIGKYLDQANLKGWVEALRRHREELTEAEMLPLIYAIVCGRVGSDFLWAFSSGRSWEISLQLHMGLCSDANAAKQVGRYLRNMVRSAFVKVAFTPHYPHCFLVARDLEHEGIPVNFTSTFSARQTVAAALLSNVTTTNIFMGRLNQGLQAELLGEHVDLEAQRAIKELRRQAGTKTQLIVASMRDWETFVRTAGCDVYTAPVGVIRDFMNQSEIPPEEIRSQLSTSYEDRLAIGADALQKLGAARIARLYQVEPEFIEFLKEYRQTVEYRNLEDGDRLFKRFDKAGFGDLFYAPKKAEWDEIRRDKVPNLNAPLTQRVSLDTLYSLLADADFEKYQDNMDREIKERLEN
ncbi:MAG TPA: transaldolase family protein [Candidatus Binatia bacterium]|nr:transaldolase family protein [Candidatus Binatia bacterium]